jgi:uncharacterized damage-inducible protein DinB
MSGEDRTAKIESYGRAYETLTEALKEFPREMWHFRIGPDDWSIHELVVHITDSEANSYARCRRLIAEPGTAIMSYDENQWALALTYHERSTEDAVELFKWLRLTSYKLIKSIPETTWTNTIYHPEHGTMTMDDWLDEYERHVRDHVNQMRRNYKAWKSDTGR